MYLQSISLYKVVRNVHVYLLLMSHHSARIWNLTSVCKNRESKV